MTKNRVTGLIAVILGAAVAVAAFQLPKSTIIGDVGPAVFPFITAGIFLICGIGLLVTGGGEAGPLDSLTALKRLGIIVGVLIAYCVAMNFIGFLIPSIAVLYVLASMFSADSPRPWWQKLIYAVAIAMAIYLLFHNVLNLKLPSNQLF